MFYPGRGGQQTGRGGDQQRRDASRAGRRQENASSNRGEGGGRGGGRGDSGGRGGGRGDSGGRGGGRGHCGGRGGGRGDSGGRGSGWGDGRGRGGGHGGGGGRGRGGGRRDGSRSQGSGADRGNQQASVSSSGTPNSATGGEQGGRSRSRGGRGGEHMSAHHQGGTTRYTGPGTVTAGSRQNLFPYLFQDPLKTQDESNQQASGSTSAPQRGTVGHEKGRGREGAPEVCRIGYKTFEGLVDKEASEVAITLSSSLGLKNLLDDKSMGNNMIQLVCQVLCKAFQARNDRKIVLHLANVVKSSVFFRNILPYYVTAIMSENLPARRQQYPQHLSNIISLLSDVLNMFPYSSVQSVSILVALLKPVVYQLRASGVDIPDSVDEGLERVQGLVDHLQEKSREGTLRSDKYSFLAANEEAPPGEEDFRTMSIYPTLEEFHLDHNPFLRPNIITQRFPSARIYLDTHFRLLREDFVRPLREGIREILKSQHNENLGAIPQKKRRIDDIRIYKDTRLVVPLCTPTGIAYTVQFDPQHLKFVRWENSKRLLYGSLVCLSMDNFETFLFAVVNDRDPKLLKEGKVDLCFSSDSRASLARVEPSHSFLMVETTAYFEAYRYVLEGLQEQDENELPFQRYIVECSTEVHAPAYLQIEGRKYDLSNIVAEGQDKILPFNPLVPEAWPDEEKMGLDESQLRALNLALTHELTIIQGPPGTGKTYVGLKIARALLDNHQAWSCGRPMLVVCYTNHALDQFLEGIHGFLKEGIVRVGGRSNSEILKRFALRELTRAANFRKNLPAHLRRAHHEIYTQMKDAEGLLKRQSAQLKCILSGVLKEEFLSKYISSHHWDTLCLQPMWDGFERKKPSFIVEWLGIGFSIFQQGPQQTGGAEAEDSDEAQEDKELLDIDEEADLIQAERILEDAEYQERNGRKKQRNKETEVDAMAELMLSMSLNDTEIHPDHDGTAADEEGFQFQKHQKKKMKQTVKHELMKSSVMSEEEEKRESNVWNFHPKDRWRLYRLWVLRYRIDLRTKALQAEQMYQEAAERLNEIRLREDLCVLQEARVIGMTTTGAAKYRQALQELKPRLVVVEEAAEVMEAHTITTLSPACQHLILIGDHQQLRPSATVYDLARNFNLEVSMFERLIKVGFPFERLNYQHRMRPCIARLLTPHIYAELENHPSVLEYDNIKGIMTNLFFVDHRQPEEEIKDGRSHQNPHEAQFVVALCRYLLCQEYKPSQITILTTYTGQLYCLRRLMTARQFSGVKVHVVDKYQGEENDIVILSLVRSNFEKRVGFLNIPNRVCVALSRAKMALYCIGNMDMLGTVPLWSNILHTLRESDQVGRALTLSCFNHPDKQTLVSCAEDFKSAPEGGCDQPCQYRLDCGHVCARMCHPYDADHKKYQCNKNCTKVLCELKHTCPRLCYQDCGKCLVPIEKLIPSCQHVQKVPCHEHPATFVCQEPCQKTLMCGHPCKAKCGESCTTRCIVKVPIELKCGHTQKEACFISRDPKTDPQCRTKCGTTLKCGHPCPGTCHECYHGRLHKGCAHKCQRILVCSHECQEPCVRDCPPCSFPCENRCVHSICKKACGVPCTPCKEPCAWQCTHHRCTKLCHEPCNRPPCSVPCNKTLPCGHRCIGLCGDPCPEKCRVCHADDVTEIFFGTEDEPDACFIQLEDCNHLFESTGMDRYMNLDEDREANLDQRAIKLKNCPRCRTPIRRNLRYGTHINRSLAAIEMVKEKISGVPAVIRQQQDDLSLQLVEKSHLIQYLPKEFNLVSERLDMTDLSLQRLWELENLMTFLEKFGKLVKMQKECTLPGNDDVISRRIGESLKFLVHPNQRFSNQQVSDLEREFRRLSHLAELNVRCQTSQFKVLGVELNREIRQLREILEDTLPFSEGLELTVKRMFAEIDPRLPRSGLGVTDDERVMIVKAIGLNKGHWYKCPNGHVYAIGDCGGAMVHSKCPECEATIGGANHTLAQGNALASEMDGAEYAAWSDHANMANRNFM